MTEGQLITSRWRMPGLADPPDNSVVGTPARRPRSVRRTSHLTATFPDGPAAPGTWGTSTQLVLGGRDLRTGSRGNPQVLAAVQARFDLTSGREIGSVSCDPPDGRISALAGRSAGRGFRAAAAAALGEPGRPDDTGEAGNPASGPANESLAYFVLDDVAVVSGICGVAWSQHQPLRLPARDKQVPEGARDYQRTSAGRVACSGLRPGGYHEQSWDRGLTFPHWVQLAGQLEVPDPWAWHAIEPAAQVCFRRRRRMDVWAGDDRLLVDAHFRDSVWSPTGAEVALHEYSLRAEVDPGSQTIGALEVISNVLPFPECPWAAPHAERLVGMPCAELRTTVPEALTELESCSHLNDMLRGLADVGTLAADLP